MGRARDPLSVYLDTGSRDFRVRNVAKLSPEGSTANPTAKKKRSRLGSTGDSTAKAPDVTPSSGCDHVLPPWLRCHHETCNDGLTCIVPTHWEIVIPVEWGKVSTNALLGGHNRQRYAASKPIRQAAVEAARELAMIRVSHAVVDFTPLVGPRSRIDLDACDLWTKHFIDGLATNWNPPPGVKGHDPTFLPGELTSAGVLPGDGAAHYLSKHVFRAERANANAIRVIVIANFGQQPHWTPWE